jgi:hypothetical protein
MDSLAAGCLLALYRPRLPRISPLWWLLLLVAPLISGAGEIQAGWPVPQLFAHLSTVIFDALVVVLIVEVTKHPQNGSIARFWSGWLTELQPPCMANAVPESRLQNQSGNWSSVGVRDG